MEKPTTSTVAKHKWQALLSRQLSQLLVLPAAPSPVAVDPVVPVADSADKQLQLVKIFKRSIA